MTHHRYDACVDKVVGSISMVDNLFLYMSGIETDVSEDSGHCCHHV